MEWGKKNLPPIIIREKPQSQWKLLIEMCVENTLPIGETLGGIITSTLTPNQVIEFYEWMVNNPEEALPITPLLLVDVALSLSQWKVASDLYAKGWRPTNEERKRYIIAFNDIYKKGSPRKGGVTLPNENTHKQRKWFIDHNIILEEEIPKPSSPGRPDSE